MNEDRSGQDFESEGKGIRMCGKTTRYMKIRVETAETSKQSSD